MKEFFRGVFALDMGELNFAFLEITLIALGQVDGFTETTETASAVAAIALKVTVTKAVLLLELFDEFED